MSFRLSISSAVLTPSSTMLKPAAMRWLRTNAATVSVDACGFTNTSAVFLSAEHAVAALRMKNRRMEAMAESRMPSLDVLFLQHASMRPSVREIEISRDMPFRRANFK